MFKQHCEAVLVDKQGRTLLRSELSQMQRFSPDSQRLMQYFWDSTLEVVGLSGQRDSIKLPGFAENLVWLDGHRMAYSLIDEVHVVTVLR